MSKKRREKNDNKKSAAGKRGRERMSERGMVVAVAVVECVCNVMCDHKIK
jgi:hypothetical protein